MIDHTNHPHPSTPKARALCRANGGTGFIGKLGGDTPTVRKDNNKISPKVINTTPKKPEKPKSVPKGPTIPKDHGTPKPNVKAKAKSKPGLSKIAHLKDGDQLDASIVGIRDLFDNISGEDAKIPPSQMRVKGPVETIDLKGKVLLSHQSKASVSRVRHYLESGIPDDDSNLPNLTILPSGKVVIKDGNHRLIASLLRGDTKIKANVHHLDNEKVPPPNKPTAERMDSYIPRAPGNTESDKIQNALRARASREFIASRSKMPPTTVDREIDRILKQYGVPNHVYPRRGTGGPAPKIEDVKKPLPVPKNDTVPTPTSPDTIGLGKVKVDVKPQVKGKVDRVLKVQEGYVGGKVARINAIDNSLPAPDTTQGRQWNVGANTLAVCTNTGHIHLHEHIDKKDTIVNQAMASGWFTKGGEGIEQTIAHEMGHAFLNNYRMSPDQRKRIANVLENDFGLTNPWGASAAIYATTLDGIVTHRNNRAKVKRLVSKYGATNASEMMAEVWAEYTMNPKPRPRIKKLGDVLKVIIGEGVL